VEQASLAEDAAESEKLLELLFGLDPFSDDPHSQVVGKAHDRAGRDPVVAPGAKVPDEGAVDLEGIDLESVEVTERGVAGAEVVEVDVESEALELAENRNRRVGFLHHDVLRHVENQSSGRELGLGEDLFHPIGEVGLEELLVGHVHVDRERAASAGALLPALNLEAGLAKHLEAELDDEARFLRRREKRRRR
jgi:hypothetical protein